MPILTVIAGPNGAGKSTHSKELLSHQNIEAFDFDKELYILWSRFDFDLTIEQGVYDQTLELYESKKAVALEQNINFAFETNFHTRQILTVINSFIEKGYKTELIFIYLENVELAIERVKDRVAKGGHHVDEKTIKERFDNGLTFLDESFNVFDVVSLFVSKHRTIEAALILQPKLNNVVTFSLENLRLLDHLPSINEYVIKYGRQQIG